MNIRFVFVHVCVRMDVRVYANLFVRVGVCVRTCVCIRVCESAYVCMYINVYMFGWIPGPLHNVQHTKIAAGQTARFVPRISRCLTAR